MSLAGHVCWKEEDARVILATEALEGSDAAFLATHAPITGFEVQGTHGADVVESTERALLGVLSAPSQRHAFCVVEGEPGSGKSHLIRWLKARWRQEGDLVLLIQRADGSLEGTIEQLIRKVPDRFRHLFAGMGSRREASLGGRARLFLATLARTMEQGYFEEEPEDANWCKTHQLGDLLDNPVVKDNWEAPGRILRILSGREASELARFTLNDVAQMASLEGRIQNEKLPPHAFRFIKRLAREWTVLRSFLDAGRTEEDIQREAPEQLRFSFALMQALNLRLDHAVQNLLGISSRGLRDLFLGLRRELRQEQRRLVLLLEDITNFQGIDRQLIDVLVTQSATREEGDLCDLVSAVGITPAYFRQYLRTMGNYVERITYHVRLGREQPGSQYQDVASLRNPDDQVRFAANYLRATRAGLERLEAWGDRLDEPVPNICATCTLRESCHSSFGAVEGVGLYPFIGSAITGMFERLQDPQGGATHQTPRGLIQGILNPTLRYPRVIEEQKFPSAHTDIPWIPAEKLRLGGEQKDLLAAQVPNDPETRQRLERLIALWGTRTRLQTTVDHDGALLFAGLPRGVYEAFSLPWLGDKNRLVQTPSPPPPPPRGPETSLKPELQVAIRRSLRNDPIRSTTRPGTSTKPVVVTSKEVDKRQDQLNAWREKGRLEDPGYWACIILELLNLLPWSQMGVPPFLRDRFFKERLIKIEGTTEEKRDYYFELPAAPWLQDGLESYLRLNDSRSEGDPEQQRRRVARALTALGKAVVARARRVVPDVDGSRWSIVGTCTQFLAVSEWVRGAFSPEDPLVNQWERILRQDTPGGTGGTKNRSAAWGRVVEGTKNRAKDRELLRGFAALYDKDGVLFVDAADSYAALRQLRESFQCDPGPEGVPTSEHWGEMRSLASRVRAIGPDLASIPEAEIRRLRDWCEEISARLRQRSLTEHIQRLEAVRDQVLRQIPVSSSRPKDWNICKETLAASGALAETSATKLVDFVDDALAYESSVRTPAAVFDWALSAPVTDLGDILETLRTGDAMVQDLFLTVQTYVGVDDSATQVSLDQVHAAGQRLKSVGDTLRSGLGGEA